LIVRSVVSTVDRLSDVATLKLKKVIETVGAPVIIKYYKVPNGSGQ